MRILFGDGISLSHFSLHTLQWGRQSALPGFVVARQRFVAQQLNVFLVLQRRDFEQIDRLDIERQPFLFQRDVRRANGSLALPDHLLVLGRHGRVLRQTREIARRIFDPIDAMSRRRAEKSGRRTEFRLRRSLRSLLDRLEWFGRAARRFQLFFDDFVQHVRREF